MLNPASILACPNCQATLKRQDTQYVCENLHYFDIAKQGYTNLLLPNQKNSVSPGDTNEMVRARRDFLQKKHYEPVAFAISKTLAAHFQREDLKSHETMTLLDVGCGVGYYTQYLKDYASDLPSAVQTINVPKLPYNIAFYGLDISKEAIKLASKIPQIDWFVSSAKNLPFQNQSIDCILSVFSPTYMEEIKRCLKPMGLLAMVTPAASHLIEIRTILFDEVTPIEEDKILLKTKSDFNLLSTHPIQHQFVLNTSDDIQNLLTMTPFYWKASADKKEKLLALSSLIITIDMNLWLFQNS